MIINSLLDTDLYKFSMMQAVLHQFPSAQVEYRFKCRSPHVNLRPFIQEIRDEIRHLCSLRFTPQELDYLTSLRFIKSDFIEFLELYHMPLKCITVDKGQEDNEISIEVKGSWLHTILFEIPILSIVNEVYFKNTYPNLSWDEGRQRLQEKIAMVKDYDPQGAFFHVAEYGARRRFSLDWHREVVQTLAQQMTPVFVGTSNVLLAKELGTTPMGTMGHEFFQACQALGPRLRDSQVFALETWAKEYRGDLGIALSDTYGTTAFLRDFDMYFCKLFDGVRQDSGDPFEWGERILAHYKKNRCDPRTKLLIFSDGLNFPLAMQIADRFKDRCKLSFGIGTNLTNDMGVPSIQIVMKMVRCNGQPVAKISDTPSKTMCDDPSYLAYLRHVFEIPPEKV